MFFSHIQRNSDCWLVGQLYIEYFHCLVADTRLYTLPRRSVSKSVTFLVADTQLYKRLCPSVGPLVRWSVRPLVRPSVRDDRVGKCENAHFRPCPPVRNWYWPCIRPCFEGADLRGLVLVALLYV